MNILRLPLQAPGWMALLAFAAGGSLLLAVTEVFQTRAPDFTVLIIGLSLGMWFVVAGVPCGFGAHLFAAAARGLPEQRPAHDVLNPFTSLMVPVVLVLTWLIASLTRNAALASPALWSVAAPALAIAPASVSIMLLGHGVADGFDPRRIVALVRGLGSAYLGVCALQWIGFGAVFAALWYGDGFAFVTLFAAGYVFLLAQHASGRVVFLRRAELDLFTEHSPEQDVANAVAADERELASLLVELHRLCAVDRYPEAIARLDAYLARDHYRNDARVHEALRQFQGRPLALEHACQYIERLIAGRKTIRAWEVCKRCVDEDPLFRPLSDSSVISLVGLSGHRDAGHAAILLRDFARAYPNSPLRANAAFRLAQIEIEHLNDRAAGVALLRSIRDTAPQFARLPKFAEYVERFGDLDVSP